MNNIFLIEDHDEVLKIWRRKNIKGLDLIHLDAHIDFGFYEANPIEQVFKDTKSLRELKGNLEKSLAYSCYEKDFNKQSHIGNYIYPAMCEGIVKDFYWVLPGGLKEFKKSLKFIKEMLKNFTKQDPYQLPQCKHEAKRAKQIKLRIEDGLITTLLFGRKFTILTLEKLPILKQKVLLDIDTDFLVIDSLLNANNTAKIGKRKRWIRPDRLVNELLNKKLKSVLTTIAYSVNGGYTPMHYKVLGDELAYRLSPRRLKERFAERLMASTFFDLFESTGKKGYYQKAVKLNPGYRAADNNYGALYLRIRKFSKAKKEFLRIAKVDPKNPYPFIGLGNIALEKGKFCEAKGYFFYALKLKRDLKQALFGLAQAEFGLNNLEKAKFLFRRYQALKFLQPQSYYFLGCIYEKEKNFEEAVAQYQDAMRLGLNNIEVISRLLKIACHLKTKDGIIKYVIAKYRAFKREFLKIKRLNLKKGGRIRGLCRIGEKLANLERRLRNVS